MLLALDVGNTELSLGLGSNGRLIGTRRASTPSRATPDELELLLAGLLRLERTALADLEGIAVVSVVPAVSASLAAVAERHALPCFSADASNLGLAVRVDRPAEVGADRLVNALGVASLVGTPAVVVDLGTATTLDAVASDGSFLGGAIAPGLVLGLDALATRTAKLPHVEPTEPASLIGRDTASAIRAGAVTGHRLLVEGLLAGARAELAAREGIAPDQVHAVLTGGLSALPWAQGIAGVERIEPTLTLAGLLLAWEGSRLRAGASRVPSPIEMAR